MFRRVLLLAAFVLTGCHHPARQNVPQPSADEQEAQWRNDLAPGTKADRALAELLTRGFDCELTRDNLGRVVRIVATQRESYRDASGARRILQIDLAVHEEKVQSIKITPLLG